MIKDLTFLGSSYEDLCELPRSVQNKAGYQLYLVQRGDEPNDWKPMSTIGAGVKEIRLCEESGAYRVIYVAKFEHAIYVLHAFQKKTQKTDKRDLDLAAKRYRDLLQEMKQ